MYYALICKPQINTSKIDYFQQKYDPYSRLAGAHFTLVFPTPDEIDEQQLLEHIKSVLKRWKPFNIHIRGLEKSWDQWLFLNVQEGKNQFIQLHDELYSGPLEPYLRKDLPYTPHISLGLFVENRQGYNIIELEKLPLNEAEFEKVYKEVEAMNLDYHTTVEKAEFLTLNDEMNKVLDAKELSFG